MATEEIKKDVTVEEFEAVKAELEQTKDELEKYKGAYAEQVERYNSLFGLFVNNIDYIVANTYKRG